MKRPTTRMLPDGHPYSSTNGGWMVSNSEGESISPIEFKIAGLEHENLPIHTDPIGP
jgi:hypothetical protein